MNILFYEGIKIIIYLEESVQVTKINTTNIFNLVYLFTSIFHI